MTNEERAQDEETEIATAYTERLNRARNWIAFRTGAKAGQNGRLHTKLTANKLLSEFGVDKKDVLVLLQEWNLRCIPAWTAEELESILNHEVLAESAESDLTTQYDPTKDQREVAATMIAELEKGEPVQIFDGLHHPVGAALETILVDNPPYREATPEQIKAFRERGLRPFAEEALRLQRCRFQAQEQTSEPEPKTYDVFKYADDKYTLRRNGEKLVPFDGWDEAEEAANVLNDPRLDKFTRTALEVGFLVRVKNRAYGSSFEKAGEYLRLLFPNGIRPDQYDDALTLVRQFDKSMRIASSKDAFGEDPFKDMLGYDILAVTFNRQKKENK